MFGDGKVEVINQDGELYINMRELVTHITYSAQELEEAEVDPILTSTLKILALTLCDLALYELGMDNLDKFQDVDSILEYWEALR